MGVHAHEGVYHDGWVGASLAQHPPPTPDLGAAGKSTQRPRARGVGGRDEVGVAGEAATAAYSLLLPFHRPPPVRPGDS